ncbi:MAG: pilus assembly protein PilM [Candidatus Margulisiibacteriota bacterium]
MNHRSVIGLDISEDVLVFSEISKLGDQLILNKLKIVNTAPKTLTNGRIIDVETLSAQVNRVLTDEGFSASNIVVGVRDKTFIKQVGLFPRGLLPTLNLALQQEVQTRSPFDHESYSIGYQVILPPGDIPTPNIPVLYAATSHFVTQSVRDLVLTTGLQLVAINLASLAAIQALVWDNPQFSVPTLFIFIDPHFADFNITWDRQIVFTQSHRVSAHTILASEDRKNRFVQTIHNFIFAAENQFPGIILQQYVMIYDQEGAPEMRALLDKAFGATYKSVIYQMDQHPLVRKAILEKPAISMRALPALGLGIQFFSSGQTLSLIPVQKPVEPVINLRQLFFAVVGVFVTVVGIMIGNVFLRTYSQGLSDQINATRLNITKLRSGEFVSQQETLTQLQTEVLQLSQFRQNAVALNDYFRLLLSDMPDDVSISSIELKSNLSGALEGSANFPNSAHLFYKKMLTNFKTVTLKKVESAADSNGQIQYTFGIEFVWK